MSREFLGRGWSFPVGIDDHGKIKTSEYEQDIREAIWLILSTSKGERVMRPDFGCGIHEFVFSVVNTTTLTLIESAVQDALVRWEPRIELAGVKAKPDSTDSGKLTIDIDYKVRSTNNRYNLVYPFYLRE